MIFERYPAPIADQLWSKESRADRMREISDAYARDVVLAGEIEPPEEYTDGEILNFIHRSGVVNVRLWEHREKATGHEIVGFLEAYLDRLPDSIHRFVHYGLTSSDLVEWDLHSAMSSHATDIYDRCGRLDFALRRIEDTHIGSKRAGRTHGQTAELTSLGHQIYVHRMSLYRINTSILLQAGQTRVVKAPGPVGNSPLRGAPSTVVGVEHPMSFQIIPRDILTGWASDYLRLAQFLESLAMFIRLGARSEIGEFQEGAAKDRQGSSAMPGKRNPIDCEKVSGLARIARGYHLALSEVPGSQWEERDLSNSSTERIAVPGLAAIVEHMLDTMIGVIENLVVDETRMLENTYDPATSANHRQNVNQRTLRVGPIEASRITKEEDERPN